MQPELELLILCAQNDLNKSQVGRIKEIIDEGLDWNLLYETALSHRTLPLLYWNVSNHFPDLIPSHIASELKNRYLNICANNIRFSQKLVYVLNLFEENEIIAVPFKGPVLSEYIFGDVIHRMFGDLDILVAKEDLEKAVRLLQADGFFFDIDLNIEQYLKLAEDGFHAALINEQKILIELHWELTGRYFSRNVELKRLRPRLQQKQFMGCMIWSFSPEDLLVYLCIHGNRDNWMLLDSISCVAGIIKRQCDLNWQKALDRATYFGARRMLLLGCLLANALFDVDINGVIEAALKHEKKLKDVSDKISNRLYACPENQKFKLSYTEEVKYLWQTMDTISDCLHYSLLTVFQPTHSDREWLRLPASMSKLYFLLRPIRLSVKYGKSMFRHG